MKKIFNYIIKIANPKIFQEYKKDTEGLTYAE